MYDKLGNSIVLPDGCCLAFKRFSDSDFGVTIWLLPDKDARVEDAYLWMSDEPKTAIANSFVINTREFRVWEHSPDVDDLARILAAMASMVVDSGHPGGYKREDGLIIVVLHKAKW